MLEQFNKRLPKIPIWFFIITGLVYFTAIKVDTMDIDASQYAQISMGMVKSGDYIHLFDRLKDYLDKPPLLFWVTSLSMRLFGMNNLGYKLPSILFALWALYATYRLTRLLYNENTGRLAALVLATCQGMFLMTNDVRCDTILMSWVITSIWLLQEWILSKKILYFILGCISIAFGMMTKGPIALLVPVFSFSINWILKREWNNFIKPHYLFGIVIIAIMLIPMSIGLYQQYDMHPEKHISGLRFFYWTQSFGRITGESPWKNEANISFLLVNMLWSFLPWIFVFLIAIVVNVKQLIKQKYRLLPNQEWISTGGFILSYLALGSSAYQLPHYIFVAFPLASITTAVFLARIIENGEFPKTLRFLVPFQIILIVILFVALIVLMTVVFPAKWHSYIVLALCIISWFRILFFKGKNEKFISLIAVGMVIINVFITNHVYYPLLKYQAGSVVGRYIHKHNIPTNEVVSFKMHDPIAALHFYAQNVIKDEGNIAELGKYNYILTMDEGLNELRNSNTNIKILYKNKLFKVSELTPEFLNPKTRDLATKNYYLVQKY